jgi:hypothetical protein
MLNLKDAAHTLRYWAAIREQQRAHTAPSDRRGLKNTIRAALPELDAHLLNLERDGVSAISGYWSEQQCHAAREELDRLMLAQPQCVRRYSNDSDKRLFGAETAGPAVWRFHDDPILKSIGEILGGLTLYNFVTLGARIDATADNRGSGEGWHRDAFGFQFKAIVYLCDVTDENGPFEYLSGSHKAWRAGFDSARGRFPVPPDSRIDSQGMEKMIAEGLIKPKRFTAKAGTVILVNSAGVHEGAPLKSGHRYALTNYYYFPYQIGKSMVEKFLPLAPGVVQRLEPFLEAERQAIGRSVPGGDGHAG